MNTIKLYTVATVRKEIHTDINSVQYEGTGARCVAICTTVDRATSIIENNEFDIYEMGYYPWAVIEEIDSDAMYCGFAKLVSWYKWEGDFETGKYVKIETPEDWENICNWGIG